MMTFTYTSFHSVRIHAIRLFEAKRKQEEEKGKETIKRKHEKLQSCVAIAESPRLA